MKIPSFVLPQEQATKWKQNQPEWQHTDGHLLRRKQISEWMLTKKSASIHNIWISNEKQPENSTANSKTMLNTYITIFYHITIVEFYLKYIYLRQSTDSTARTSLCLNMVHQCISKLTWWVLSMMNSKFYTKTTLYVNFCREAMHSKCCNNIKRSDNTGI